MAEAYRRSWEREELDAVGTAMQAWKLVGQCDGLHAGRIWKHIFPSKDKDRAKKGPPGSSPLDQRPALEPGCQMRKVATGYQIRKVCPM